MLAVLSVIDGVRAFFAEITATELRVAVTLAISVGTLALGRFVLPPTVRYLDTLISDRLLDGRVGETVNPVSRYVPTTLSGVALRLTQVAIFTVAVVSLLTVWGRYAVVEETITAIEQSQALLGQIGASAVLVLITYVSLNLLKDTIRDLSSQTDWMTEHQEEILLRMSQLGLFLGIGLVFLFVWEVKLGGVLVGAGFLGIIFGLAARQTLGALLAGFLLMFSRPFTIGDWVKIGGKEGMVTEITIFNTRIETFDGEMVVLPNDQVSEQAIVNRSSNGLLRARVDVSVDYDADPERAAALATEAIQGIDAVADVPTPDVYPKSFGNSAIVLEMRFWIEHPTPPRKMKATAAVIREVKAAFEDADIKIPYPQREVTGREGAETGFRVHEDADPGGPGPEEADRYESSPEQSTRHD